MTKPWESGWGLTRGGSRCLLVVRHRVSVATAGLSAAGPSLRLRQRVRLSGLRRRGRVSASLTVTVTVTQAGTVTDGHGEYY
jgi:hypothetical protein